MKRILTPIRLFAIALLALLALSMPSLSAHAAPNADVQCDKTMLQEARGDAEMAVVYMIQLNKSYNSSVLTNTIKEEQKVIDNTKNCKHLETAFNNAYKANGDYYNFYYNVVPANAHNFLTEASLKNLNNAYNLVEVVYGSSQP